MARKSVAGVSGVLGDLVSLPTSDADGQSLSGEVTTDHSDDAPRPGLQEIARKSHARLGRPPGRLLRRSQPKEKLTIRIDAQLAALYRDWSWEQRCQLGELIERALRDYREKETQ